MARVLTRVTIYIARAALRSAYPRSISLTSSLILIYSEYLFHDIDEHNLEMTLRDSTTNAQVEFFSF